jgi:hypothetical protein
MYWYSSKHSSITIQNVQGSIPSVATNLKIYNNKNSLKMLYKVYS